MLQISLLLVKKTLAVGDEQLRIARVRLVNGRIVDFIKNAVAQREPDMTARMVSRPDPLFGAVRPAWVNPRRTKGTPW